MWQGAFRGVIFKRPPAYILCKCCVFFLKSHRRTSFFYHVINRKTEKCRTAHLLFCVLHPCPITPSTFFNKIYHYPSITFDLSQTFKGKNTFQHSCNHSTCSWTCDRHNQLCVYSLPRWTDKLQSVYGGCRVYIQNSPCWMLTDD